MISNLMTHASRNELTAYVLRCVRHVNRPDFDGDELFRTAETVLLRHEGKPYEEAGLARFKALEDRWSQSLAAGVPDYTVYADPFYFAGLWVCWTRYSRKYVKAITAPRMVGDKSIKEFMGYIGSVIDIGCGPGYATAALKTIYPTAHVLGINLRETVQYRMASEIGTEYGFHLADSYIGKHADLVFASEYFEHLPNPIEQLSSILQNIHPRFLLVANTFSQPSLGHFPNYVHGGEAITGRKTGRLFGETLRAEGYEAIKTRCWNNRPMLWKLNRRNDER